jgi:hypothetical protein
MCSLQNIQARCLAFRMMQLLLFGDSCAGIPTGSPEIVQRGFSKTRYKSGGLPCIWWNSTRCSRDIDHPVLWIVSDSGGRPTDTGVDVGKPL